MLQTFLRTKCPGMHFSEPGQKLQDIFGIVILLVCRSFRTARMTDLGRCRIINRNAQFAYRAVRLVQDRYSIDRFLIPSMQDNIF